MRLRQALRKNREEEFQDYLNRISCLEKEIVNGEKTIPVLNKARITLEEYADLAESTKKLFMMLFAEPLEQEEVYFVHSCTRNNTVPEKRHNVLRSYENLFLYIQSEGAELMTHKNREPAEKTMWWRAERKKLYDTEFHTTLICEFDLSGNVIYVQQGEKFRERYREDERFEALSQKMRIVGYKGANLPFIELPFRPGDILYADLCPQREPKECIYLGPDWGVGCAEHLCLIRDGDYYRVSSLRNMRDNGSGRQPYFLALQKRECTLDRYIGKAYNAIKNHPDAVQRILELAEQQPYKAADLANEYIDSVLSRT